jgi:N-alpha-acetyltransferase 38, NatC auxiliary subunit
MATETQAGTSAAAFKDADESAEYLATYLNKTLHIHITDGRMFVGQMKCTDNERNIILAIAHEYRQPSNSDIKLAAERHEKSGSSGNVKVDMKMRFVGLVVVPGQYITKMEVEG